MATTAARRESVDLRVDGDPTRMEYLTAGEGPPLVLVHGVGLDAATVSWRHAFPALTEDFTVYAPDLPGHGGSDAPRRTYTTGYFVDALDAFLEALELTGPTTGESSAAAADGGSGPSLVGLSMGGAVALGHALNGGSPARLALVDSYGLGEDAYWRSAASVALRLPFAGNALWGSVASRPGVRSNLQALAGGPVPEDLVEDVHASVDRSSMRTLRSWQRHEFQAGGLRTDYSDRLAELSTPTLVVHGAEDPLLPASWSRRAADRLPDATLRVVEDCGHWPPRECPELFNRVLAEFLRDPAGE